MDGAPLPETCCADERATIWIWLGQAAYLGPSLRLDAHSGSVHCFALGVDAPFTPRADAIGERRARSALIPARTRHRVIADGGRMLFFYLDPGSGLAEGVRARMSECTFTVCFGYRHESSLPRHVREASFPDPARPREFVNHPHADAVDERIRTAIGIMRAHPDRQVSAAELAAEVKPVAVTVPAPVGADAARSGCGRQGYGPDRSGRRGRVTASSLLSGHTRLVVLDA